VKWVHLTDYTLHVSLYHKKESILDAISPTTTNRNNNRLIVGPSEDVEAFFLITQILSSVTTYYYTSERFLRTSLKLSHFCYLGFNSQQGQKISYLLQNFQTSSAAHPTSNWMVLWDLYLGVKQPGRDDHSPPSND